MLFCFFVFFYCLLFIFFYNVHFMHLLIVIELMLLSVFYLLCCFFNLSYGLAVCFFFLLVMVCMGGLGISLLVFSSRFFGRDFFFNYYIF